MEHSKKIHSKERKAVAAAAAAIASAAASTAVSGPFSSAQQQLKNTQQPLEAKPATANLPGSNGIEKQANSQGVDENALRVVIDGNDSFENNNNSDNSICDKSSSRVRPNKAYILSEFWTLMKKAFS